MKRTFKPEAEKSPPSLPVSVTPAQMPAPSFSESMPDITKTMNQIAGLMDQLKTERQALVARLERVDEILGNKPEPEFVRPKNEMKLKDVVALVLKKGPATKPEILDSVLKMGYEFYGKSPKASVNVVLYTKKNKFRKMDGGRFLPPEE